MHIVVGNCFMNALVIDEFLSLASLVAVVLCCFRYCAHV